MEHLFVENEGLIGSELNKLMEPLRKEKPSQMWMSGKEAIKALDNKRYDENYRVEFREQLSSIWTPQGVISVDCQPPIRILNSIYISDLKEGEELYIIDDENNVFVNRDKPYIVHILVLCKTENKIFPKWISLAIFWYDAIEFIDGCWRYSIDNLKSYNEEAWLNYFSETFSGQLKDDKVKYYKENQQIYSSGSSMPFKIYPATNDKNDVYKDIIHCKTNLELWEKIKGRCLKVKKITPVRTFEPKEHSITQIKVPAFSFIDKDIDKEIMKEHHYKPEYFFGDYRIIVNLKTRKRGIKDLKTGKMVVPCEFTDIGYHRFYNAQYVNSPILVVSFFKDGQEALIKAEDLRRLRFGPVNKKKNV